jgi:hypothetical protein
MEGKRGGTRFFTTGMVGVLLGKYFITRKGAKGQRSKELKEKISTSLRGAPKRVYSREDVDARRGNLIILMRNERSIVLGIGISKQ